MTRDSDSRRAIQTACNVEDNSLVRDGLQHYGRLTRPTPWPTLPSTPVYNATADSSVVRANQVKSIQYISIYYIFFRQRTITLVRDIFSQDHHSLQRCRIRGAR